MAKSVQNPEWTVPLSAEECLKRLQSWRRQGPASAFYSSVLGGITLHQEFMAVPMDDHMVHRGDGVFEAIRFQHGSPYLLAEHLDRMVRSCAAIALKLPLDLPRIREICLQLIELSQLQSGLLRLFVSRGAGGFSVSPLEPKQSEFYAVVTQGQEPSPALVEKGVVAIRSNVPQKPAFFAQIKSCNYLPNALMKAEALQSGADYSLGFSAEGFLTESATENVILLTNNKELVFPNWLNVLEGCTLKRLLVLAQPLLAQKELSFIGPRDLQEHDCLMAQEMGLVGTTLLVLPVRQFANRTFPSLKLMAQLRALLAADLPGRRR